MTLARGSGWRSGQAELLEASEGVFQRPGTEDPSVAEPEDGDLIDPLEAAPSRSLAEPFPQVGGRTGEAADDLVAFGDQLHDLHVHVGEAGSERPDPASGGRDQLGDIQLVDDLQVAAVEDLVDQPAHDRLVGLGHHAAPGPWRSRCKVLSAAAHPGRLGQQVAALQSAAVLAVRCRRPAGRCGDGREEVVAALGAGQQVPVDRARAAAGGPWSWWRAPGGSPARAATTERTCW